MRGDNVNVHDLNILYKEVPNLGKWDNGKIKGSYLISANGKSLFAVEVEYSDSKTNKKIIGILGYDEKKHTINGLNKEDILLTLDAIVNLKEDKNKKKHLITIMEEIKRTLLKNYRFFECMEYFVLVDQRKRSSLRNSLSKLVFEKLGIDKNISFGAIYSSPAPQIMFAKISAEDFNDVRLKEIDYLTNVKITISIDNNNYEDHGNIVKTKIEKDEISLLIEPLSSFMLNQFLLEKLFFSNLNLMEVFNLTIGNSKIVKLEKNDENKPIIKKRYKVISTIKNFKLSDSNIAVGNIELSTNIDVSKDIRNQLNCRDSDYIYATTYVSAETMAEAQKTGLEIIQQTLDFIIILLRNSTFYEKYNFAATISEWDAKKLFISPSIGEYLYICELFNPDAHSVTSLKMIKMQNSIDLDKESSFERYIDDFGNNLLDLTKNDKIFSSMYWLNKGLTVIDSDIEESVIYLNIAFEYCTSGEEGISFVKKYENGDNILTELKELIKDKYKDFEGLDLLTNILEDKLKDTSLTNRFVTMIKRLNVNITEEQRNNVNSIRKARNKIIHGHGKLDIDKPEIIKFYIFISKVIVCKFMERCGDKIEFN